MKVIKRDNTEVDYDGSKIVIAVQKAILDANPLHEGYEEADSIEIEMRELIEESQVTWSIEDINNEIEKLLMSESYGLFEAGKAFILYRKRKEGDRGKEPKYHFLSKEFLSKYKHRSTPMTEIGNLVYYRTYSRYLPELKRREYWWETVARAVNHNCSLQKSTTIEEAELLYDNMFNLRQFLSGRSLWSGGTETAIAHPISQYNCSGIVIDNFDNYKDICYLLMLGCGVGFNTQKEYINKLPKVRSDITIMHQNYMPVNKHHRKESTEYNITDSIMEIIVGDSKLGWSNSIDLLLKSFYAIDFKHVSHVMINYNNIRPHGEPLKTFGGTASGHEALLTILDKISKVLKKNNTAMKRIKPIDAMDIANIIAEGIVVGGVRRSAEMCFFDADDTEIMEAKSNLYEQNESGEWVANSEILHRMMSNNSTAHETKPTLKELKKKFITIRHSAEGNFYNLEAARKRKPNCKISNPCGEILLDSHQFCNLTTVNMMAFVEDGMLNEIKLLEAQKLSARAGYRVATLELELPKWNEMQSRDRLIGCSFTGWQDMVNATSMSMEEQIELAKKMRVVANSSANEYADSLGLNRPELVTSVKPEGTLSQLPTVSSGLHYSHSPFYIRRVRINSSDPLVKVCEELGYPIFPEVGQDIETCRTKVIEFPVKAPMGKTKYEVSAIEQLELYKMFMEHYVDHNASNTISVRDEEWDGVIQWVYDNWDFIIGITFISLDNSFYQLLPYEACTEEEYDKRRSTMKPFNSDLLLKYEVREEDDLIDDECTTGACPIR